MQIRKTSEMPPRVSVVDVAVAGTRKTQSNAARDIRRIADQSPEIGTDYATFKFQGRGQRETPVTDTRGVTEIVMLLPGHQAAFVRCQAAQLLVRYLSGDMRIIDEVCVSVCVPYTVFKKSLRLSSWR